MSWVSTNKLTNNFTAWLQVVTGRIFLVVCQLDHACLKYIEERCRSSYTECRPQFRQTSFLAIFNNTALDLMSPYKHFLQRNCCVVGISFLYRIHPHPTPLHSIFQSRLTMHWLLRDRDVLLSGRESQTRYLPIRRNKAHKYSSCTRKNPLSQSFHTQNSTRWVNEIRNKGDWNRYN